MPTLLEKIEANAAQRLTLHSGAHPRNELARYKNFLKVEAHRLKILHRGGAGGREVCQARAAVLDALIRHIFDDVRAGAKNDQSASQMMALVAVGGYGRGELNPFSDVDLQFLHSSELVTMGKAKPYMNAVVDGLLYTLWDIGLKVGHSVRSVDDCVKAANTDMQSKTSLIEARFVAGDASLFEQMQRVVVARCVRGHENEYIAARIADQEARRAKYGKSAYMQEPNIKNGSGGLRDYQNLLWMLYFKYRVRTLKESEQRELINEAERKQLESAYDFLLCVRTELHYHVNRAVDVLSRNVQPTMAHNLGYTDRSPARRLEKFMRVLYTHMRNIYLITRTLEQRLALSREQSGLPSLRGLWRAGRERALRQHVDGFTIIDREIRATTPRVFREQPRRLMRLFLYMQQRRLRLHPDLAQMIRNHLALVNRAFLKDEHVHQTFLEILSQRGNVAPILRLMHEAGLLGKYLPEFGKLTCLVQHEFYHRYTADEHTLVCTEQLDRIWDAQKPPTNAYAELFLKLERPFLLYLALLLHDAGKAGNDADHAEASARMALNVAKRLNLDGATTHTLCLVIEHHLLLAQISQRRDLDDAAVIRNVARQIQTTENLNLLTILTYADSQATSPDLWNGFKDSLLWMLHKRTMQMFTGTSDFLRAEEKQRELLAQQVNRLVPRSFGTDELQAHFEHLPPRYFQSRNARQIFNDLALAHRFMHLQLAEGDQALEPVTHWHNDPDRGFTSVTICTWDRVGLFTNIVGSLSAAGLNILNAEIYTRTDGIILDTFFVIDAKTGLLAARESKDEFERLLKAVLTGSVNLEALIARQKSAHPPYCLAEDERIPTLIRFDNETSDYFTVIEIETEDRVGLLYVISHTLAELQLDIALAKIATEKGAAIDSFYVTDENDRKVTAKDYQHYIEDQLRAAVASLDVA